MATIQASKNGVGGSDVILQPGKKATIEFSLTGLETDGSAFGFQCPELGLSKPCKPAGKTLVCTLEAHETLGLNLRNFFRVVGTVEGKCTLVTSGQIFFE